MFRFFLVLFIVRNTQLQAHNYKLLQHLCSIQNYAKASLLLKNDPQLFSRPIPEDVADTALTPLMISVQNNDLEIATLLLKYGACIHESINNGKTALSFAKSPEMQSLLKENRAIV